LLLFCFRPRYSSEGPEGNAHTPPVMLTAVIEERIVPLTAIQPSYQVSAELHAINAPF